MLQDEIEDKLKKSMKEIYARCATTAKDQGQPNNIALGAYVAAFTRLADSMFEQGSV